MAGLGMDPSKVSALFLISFSPPPHQGKQDVNSYVARCQYERYA